MGKGISFSDSKVTAAWISPLDLHTCRWKEHVEIHLQPKNFTAWHLIKHSNLFLLITISLMCNLLLKPSTNLNIYINGVCTLHVLTNIGHLQMSLKLLVTLLCSRPRISIFCGGCPYLCAHFFCVDGQLILLCRVLLLWMLLLYNIISTVSLYLLRNFLHIRRH
jgi:hypothetical protein